MSTNTKTPTLAERLSAQFGEVKFHGTDINLTPKLVAKGDLNLRMAQNDWLDVMSSHGVTPEVVDCLTSMCDQVGEAAIRTVDGIIEQAVDCRHQLIDEAQQAVEAGSASTTQCRLAVAERDKVTVSVALGQGPIAMDVSAVSRSVPRPGPGSDKEQEPEFGVVEVALRLQNPACVTSDASNEIAQHCEQLFGGKR